MATVDAIDMYSGQCESRSALSVHASQLARFRGGHMNSSCELGIEAEPDGYRDFGLWKLSRSKLVCGTYSLITGYSA